MVNIPSDMGYIKKKGDFYNEYLRTKYYATKNTV